MADVSGVRRAAAAMGGVCLALAGCGSSSRDTFAPACPRPAILADAGSLTRYRGSGRDFLDTVLQGEVERINGSCTQDGARTVAASLTIGMRLVRGPATPQRVFEVPYFVAVTRGDQILDKQVYVARATFPENTDRIQVTSDPVDLRLPVTDTLHADAYQITVGFQLSPAELAGNRRR